LFCFYNAVVKKERHVMVVGAISAKNYTPQNNSHGVIPTVSGRRTKSVAFSGNAAIEDPRIKLKLGLTVGALLSGIAGFAVQQLGKKRNASQTIPWILYGIGILSAASSFFIGENHKK
jgi:hypothetical protein